MRTVAGIGPGYYDDGDPSANRDSITRTVPFDSAPATVGTIGLSGQTQSAYGY